MKLAKQVSTKRREECAGVKVRNRTRNAQCRARFNLGQITSQLKEKDAQLQRMAQDAADLEVKYLAKLTGRRCEEGEDCGVEEEKADTRKGLSALGTEILAEQDKWLPHAREEKSKTGQRGKLPGAGRRAARPEKIHYEKHVKPAHCPRCGVDLEGAREKQLYSQVVTDIENLQDDPKDNKILALRNVQIFHHGRWCQHGKKWAYNDLGAIKWPRYGLNFVIFVVSKRIATRMPFELTISDLVMQLACCLP